MAINITDFDKIWASTSQLTPYSFTDANYNRGWDFVGSTPPSRQMWDSIQKKNDEKTQYLFNVGDDFLGNIVSSFASNNSLPVGTTFPSTSVLSKMISQMNLDDDVKYDFSDSSSWYICFGAKFGNLIVQGATKTATFNATTVYGAVFESSNIYTQTRFTFPIPFTSFYTSSISMTHSNGASLFIVKAEKGENWIQVNYIDSVKSLSNLTVDIHYVVFGI